MFVFELLVNLPLEINKYISFKSSRLHQLEAIASPRNNFKKNLDYLKCNLSLYSPVSQTVQFLIAPKCANECVPIGHGIRELAGFGQ